MSSQVYLQRDGIEWFCTLQEGPSHTLTKSLVAQLMTYIHTWSLPSHLSALRNKIRKELNVPWCPVTWLQSLQSIHTRRGHRRGLQSGLDLETIGWFHFQRSVYLYCSRLDLRWLTEEASPSVVQYAPPVPQYGSDGWRDCQQTMQRIRLKDNSEGSYSW